MLRRFEVEGFKNFEKRIILDLADVRDYRFNACCISDDTVSKAVVYGRNSTGKTNIGLAIFDIVSHLTSKNVGPRLYDYYLNANSDKEYAEFRYVFDFDGNLIDYIYRKNEKREIIRERLTLDDKLLFERDTPKGTAHYDGIAELAPTLNWEFNDSDSALRYFVNNSVIEDKHPIRQMHHFVSNMLWFRSLDENRYIGYKTSSNDFRDFALENDKLNELEDFLHSAGVNERLTVKQDADGNRRLYFDTKRPTPFFKTASNGTLALYTFFYWYKTAADVSLLFMDEFDAFYHFELAESIVTLLEKMSNTQVIMTSHNTNLLSNKIMRPDCYFILSDGNITSFANATDRELREGHNLEKLYQSGEFDI